MTLKLACADFTFPLLPHENVLQLIAMLEFKGVDIGLFEERSHLRPSHEFENVTESARRLKNRLDTWGLEAADIFLQMGWISSPTRLITPKRRSERRLATGSLKRLITPPSASVNM